MKKKHLQFNDITAPSLARRAARRGAEKGESGRMEPGVINVFFFFLPCKKQHWILLILFKPLPFSIPSCYFVLLPIVSSPLLEWNYLLFYSEKTCHPLPFYPLQHLILSDFFRAKNASRPGHGCSLSLLYLLLSPTPPPLTLLCLASSKCNRCLAQ